MDKGNAAQVDRQVDRRNAVILATAGYDHNIHFWEPPTGECIRTLRFSDSQVGRARGWIRGPRCST